MIIPTLLAIFTFAIMMFMFDILYQLMIYGEINFDPAHYHTTRLLLFSYIIFIVISVIFIIASLTSFWEVILR